MIKRVLVALDPDSDTPVAIRYAAEIAGRYDAEVTGLAVVDLGEIESGIRGGQAGSMYYAEKLRASWTEETRAKAQDLVRDFTQALEGSGIAHSNVVAEGVPFEWIVEDLKYHDLLVIGKDPHFFYSNPTQETEILARVIDVSAAPALVVGTEHRPVRRVLVAYDGSAAAARTLKAFVHLQPFGAEVAVELVTVVEDDPEASRLTLGLAQGYLQAHGFDVQTTTLSGGKTSRLISDHAVASDADVIVVGAKPVSALRRLAFGSTTADLLRHSPRPLFMHH